MATRRGLFGFLTIPLWLSGKASAEPCSGTITINPRELWLREKVILWLRNAQFYEKGDGKQWSTESFIRDDITYLSELLELDTAGIRQLLIQPWRQKMGGATSHIDHMAQSLKGYEDDGRLRLHLNSDNPDYLSMSDPDVHRAYAKVFPVVKEMLEV